MKFGKGVYFADICSKSANYCFATPTKDEGLLLLCEVSTACPIFDACPYSCSNCVQVALGNTNDLVAADYEASKLPKGKHSTKGMGRMVPDPAHKEKL